MLPVPAEYVLARGTHAGFPWAVVNNGIGYRCGYVCVLASDHPWFGKDYRDIQVLIHGGLSYAGPGSLDPEEGPVEEWWVGFDCQRIGDAPDPKLPRESPYVIYTRRFALHGTIKSTTYVQAQCRSLCDQASLARISTVIGRW